MTDFLAVVGDMWSGNISSCGGGLLSVKKEVDILINELWYVPGVPTSLAAVWQCGCC